MEVGRGLGGDKVGVFSYCLEGTAEIRSTVCSGRQGANPVTGAVGA